MRLPTCNTISIRVDVIVMICLLLVTRLSDDTCSCCLQEENLKAPAFESATDSQKESFFFCASFSASAIN